MVGASNQNPAAGDALEVALHTEIRIANGQHFGIDRSMGGMTGGAPFARGFVFENIRPALRWMAADASFVLRQPRRAAAPMNRAFVR